MSDYPPSSAESKEKHDDSSVDGFSSFFITSTLRASSTLPVTPQAASSTFRSQVQKEHSTADHFGSFTSVSAEEDPLSLSLASSNSSLGVPTTFEWDDDDGKLFTTPALMPVPLAVVTVSSHQPARIDNASLTFFDQFAQNAKRNSELRRKGLVNELLKCEDNPLYFLQNEKECAQKENEEGQEDQQKTFDNGELEPTPESELQTSPPSSLSLVDTVLQDLDYEYFSSGCLVNTNNRNDDDKTPSKRQCSDSSHTRSPSLPSPATLVPPFMDSDISSDLHNSSTEASTSDISLSRSSPSTFSAKWMSNLLKTSSSSGHQQQGHGATPTLESVFGVNTDTSSSFLHPPSGTSLPTAVSTASAIYRRNSSSPPIHYRSTPHPQPISHTLHTSSAPSSSATGIIKHMASPFGSHLYIPPSGAPGFRGDSYDWDKGFSNELEREIGRGRMSSRGNGNEESIDNGNTRRILETKIPVHYSAFMEKKSGNLDLKGRKASTTPVLSQNLANLLRPHLPALSRLPRSWMLVYSLDQHGISLNTLYTRCEEALSPSQALYPSRTEGVGLGTRGILLIIKSAGDEEDEGAFGAWIADGEGLGMGKKGGKGYFGGGESFLWKFTQGTLKVYKTTGKNNYVALCEPRYISFGGGDGHYGLYLDDTLYDGSSAPCPTFDNEPLFSSGPKKAGTATIEFECVGLEVWGMGP